MDTTAFPDPQPGAAPAPPPPPPGGSLIPISPLHLLKPSVANDKGVEGGGNPVLDEYERVLYERVVLNRVEDQADDLLVKADKIQMALGLAVDRVEKRKDAVRVKGEMIEDAVCDIANEVSAGCMKNGIISQVL